MPAALDWKGPADPCVVVWSGLVPLHPRTLRSVSPNDSLELLPSALFIKLSEGPMAASLPDAGCG